MISEFVEYVKQVWKNKPNVSSPLNADRLNHMEAGIENNSKKIKETVTAVNELTEKKLEKSLFQKKTITSATPGWVATGMPIKNTIILSADVISTPDGKTNYTCVKTYNKDSYTINLQIKDGDYNTPSAEGEYKIEIRYLDLTL